MQNNSVPADLILNEKIWTTPHVLQRIRRGNLLWDEYTKILVEDLAFGTSPQTWVEQLTQEGNIGLARELCVEINVNDKYLIEIQNQQNSFIEMYDYALSDAQSFLEEQKNELSPIEIENFNQIIEQSKLYFSEGAYGDAYNTIDQAHKIIRESIGRRQFLLESTYQKNAEKLQEIGKYLIRIKADKFPDGKVAYEQTKKLLVVANQLLLIKEFQKVAEISSLIEQIINGVESSTEIINEALKQTSLTSNKTENQIEEVDMINDEDIIKFERDWDIDDDAYLIDNYDVMSNDQLKAKFITTSLEIENRIRYLGLKLERGVRKRLPWRNPYVAGKPIRSDSIFFGREDVFEFIRNTLGFPIDDVEIVDRNLCALVGHRRTGKTSLLLQLKGKRRTIVEPRIPIFIDIQSLLPLRRPYLQNFISKIAYYIVEGLRSEDLDVPFPNFELTNDPAWKFREFLRQAIEITSGKGLVLMLDEFQMIEPRQSLLDIDIYDVFRSIIQHEPKIDFIISGTMEMERLMREYRAAMFGSAVTKRIDFLEEKEARKLITNPVRNFITYLPEAEDFIIDITSCHPYFIQLVCFTLTEYLVDRGKSKVFVKDVERILPLVIERGLHFDEIWATDMDDMEKYVMAIIGGMSDSKRKWCSINEVENILYEEGHSRRPQERILNAIDKLQNRRILQISEDGKYIRFQVAVFGQWVSTRKPYAIVKRDLQIEAARRTRRIQREPLNQ
jgi:hypothetical protein